MLILTRMLNYRILAQAVIKISCRQGFSIAIVTESKKAHNSDKVSCKSLKK